MRALAFTDEERAAMHRYIDNVFRLAAIDDVDVLLREVRELGGFDAALAVWEKLMVWFVQVARAAPEGANLRGAAAGVRTWCAEIEDAADPAARPS